MSPTIQSAPSPAAAPLLTVEEFVARHAGDYVELIDGMVEALPMPGARHGEICVNASLLIGGFIKRHKLGLVCSNDTFVLIRKSPARIRGADVCYWSNERKPAGEVPDGVIETPPDLVAEVRSPTDRWSDAFAKVVEYLEAGVRAVILIDPPSATASVYRSDELQQIFDNGDELTIPDVLPGFAAPVKAFFE